MAKPLLISILLLICLSGFSQNREFIQGQVLYRNTPASGIHLINVNTQKETITDQNGVFAIAVTVGDELVFTAVNYQMKRLKIDDEILNKKRLVVDVLEKVTALDEVIVTPENQQAFVKIKEAQLRNFIYEKDDASEVYNEAFPQGSRGLQHGLNFVNIFKALFKGKGKKNNDQNRIPETAKILRTLFTPEFFTNDLKIPEDKMDDFIYYCEDMLSDPLLLKKEKEFQLIDFLVNLSKSYLKLQASEN